MEKSDEEELVTLFNELEKTIAIINSLKGKFIDYDRWLDTYKNGHRGLKNSVCRSARRDLDALINTKQPRHKRFSIVRKAKDVNNSMREYICYHDQANFVDQKFLLYFHVRVSRKNPALGKVVLETFRHHKAKLYNVEGAHSPNYTGEFKIYNSTVVIFDFEAIKTKRKMHMKVVYSSLEQNIMLGAYNTFEYNHITAGSVLLQRVETNQESLDTSPMYMSHLTNKQDFLQVPQAIRRYLATTEYNYYKVPEGVSSLDELDTFVSRHRAFTSTLVNFFDVEIPNIFIATPITSTEKISYEKTLQIIADELSTRCINVNIHFSIDRESRLNNALSQITLGTLATTRIFILIIGQTQKSSFSLVQLGWALAHCRRIIIYFKNDSISDHIQALDSVHNVTLRRYNDITQDYSIISKELQRDILSETED